MIKFILTAISFLVIGILFSWIKRKITNKFFDTSKKIITNSKIGNIFRKDGVEVFQAKKFKNGMLSFFNPVEWAKDIYGIFNIRKITMILLAVSLIFGYGWWQGRIGAPVKIDLGHGKEAYIRLNGNFLHIDKNGYLWIEDKHGKKLKKIAVKDIPTLKKKLSPIGLQFVPIGIIGGSVGTNSSALEAGAGFSFARFWKWRLDTFITSYPAIYLGTSYKLDGIGLENSAIGVGYGRGFRKWKFNQSDSRAIIYFRVRF